MKKSTKVCVIYTYIYEYILKNQSVKAKHANILVGIIFNPNIDFVINPLFLINKYTHTYIYINVVS